MAEEMSMLEEQETAETVAESSPVDFSAGQSAQKGSRSANRLDATARDIAKPEIGGQMQAGERGAEVSLNRYNTMFAYNWNERVKQAEADARAGKVRVSQGATEGVTSRQIEDNLALAQALGLPYGMVAGNPKKALREFRVRQLSQDEALAEWASANERNAVLAREYTQPASDFFVDTMSWGDDLKRVTLGDVGRGVQGFGLDVMEGVAGASGWFYNIGKSLSELGFGVDSAPARWFSERVAESEKFRNLRAKYGFDVENEGFGEKLAHEFVKSIPQQAFQIALMALGGGFGAGAKLAQGMKFGKGLFGGLLGREASWSMGGGLAGRVMTPAGAATVGEAMNGLAAGTAGAAIAGLAQNAGVRAGSIAMGSMIAGGSYGELREKGVTPGLATLSALANATMQLPMESIGLERLVDIFKAKGVREALGKALVGMFGEGATEWAQKWPEYLTHTWAESQTHGKTAWERANWFMQSLFDPERIQQANQEAMLEGAIGAMWGGLGGGIRLSQVAYQRQKAAETAETLRAIHATVQKAKDAGIPQDAVASMLEAANPLSGSTALVDAKEALELYQAGVPVLDVLGGITEEELAQAADAGGFIGVKFSEMVAAADDATFEQLAPHVRLQPLSQSEAEALASPDVETGARVAVDAQRRTAEKVPGVKEELKRIEGEMKAAGVNEAQIPYAIATLSANVLNNYERFGQDPVARLKRLHYQKGDEAAGGMMQSSNPQVASEMEAVRQQYQNTEGWMKAPNGKQSALSEHHWLMVRTPAFKNWFGDWEKNPKGASRVVDKNGEPLLVYHGTAAQEDFSVFGTGKPNQTPGWQLDKEAFFFSDKPVIGDSYAAKSTDFRGNPQYNPNSKIYPVFLNIRKPLSINAKGDNWNNILYKGEDWRTNELANLAVQKKKDGVVIKNVWDYGPGAIESTAEKSNVFIVYDSTQIKSAFNAGTFDPSNPNILYQSAPIPAEPLVALHNISPNNLLRANELGGLPVPSIGITKAETPYTDFGDISLIGTRDMVDPSSNPVFSQDAYTQVFPDLEYKAVNAGAVREFEREAGPTFKRLGEEGRLYNIRNAMTSKPSKDGAVEAFINSASGKAMYLESKGETVEPVMQKPKESYYGTLTPEVQAFVGSHGAELKESDAEEFSKIYRTAIENGPYSEARKKKILSDFDANGGTLPFKSDELFGLSASSLYDMARRDSQAAASEKVDIYATDDALAERVSRDDPSFLAYAEGFVGSRFDAPTIKVGRKNVPITLENVVASMVSNRVKNKEKTLTFHGGHVRAAVSVQIKDLETLDALRSQVAEQNVARAEKRRQDGLMEAFRDAVVDKYAYSDKFSAFDDAMRALAEGATKKRGSLAKNIVKALEKYGFSGVKESDVQSGVEAIESIRKGLTPYFEAKPQRAVGLDEFVGAVIPKDASDDVRNVLKDNGITAVEYDGTEEDRKDKVRHLSMLLAETQEINILFQRAWHGTPYKFDKFTLDHIGEGEGAQVHGWGLYFAQSREISNERYRKRLSRVNPIDNADFEYNGERVSEGLRLRLVRSAWKQLETADNTGDYTAVKEKIVQEINSIKRRSQDEFFFASDIEAAIEALDLGADLSKEELLLYISDDQRKYQIGDVFKIVEKRTKDKGASKQEFLIALRDELRSVVDSMKRYGDLSFMDETLDMNANSISVVERENKGQLFEVEIPDNDVLLDEQKSIEEQPEAVKLALKNLNIGFKDEAAIAEKKKEIDSLRQQIKDINAKGNEAAERLTRKFGGGFGGKVDALAKSGNLNEEDAKDWSLINESSEANWPIMDKITRLEREISDLEAVEVPANGKEAYEILERRNGGSAKAASLALKEQGVLGITYEGGIDGRCFVIWDEEAIEILDTLYQAKKAAEMNPRGSYSHSQAQDVIRIFQGADASTVPHEAAHSFLQNLMDVAQDNGAMARTVCEEALAKAGVDPDMARRLSGMTVEELSDAIVELQNQVAAGEEQAKAKDADKEGLNAQKKSLTAQIDALTQYQRHLVGVAQAQEDLLTLREWCNVPLVGELTQEEYIQFHEQVARGFEGYLATGKAPTVKLAGVFARMKAWLLQIYKAIRDYVGADITPEVRAVYDRMLATEEEMQRDQMVNAMLGIEPDAISKLGCSASDSARLGNLLIRAHMAVNARVDKERAKERRKRWKAAYDQAYADLSQAPLWRLARGEFGKINYESIVQLLGREHANELRKKLPKVIKSNDGSGIDQIAMGYDDPEVEREYGGNADGLANYLYEEIVSQERTLKKEASRQADEMLALDDRAYDVEDGALDGDEFGDYLDAMDEVLERKLLLDMNLEGAEPRISEEKMRKDAVELGAAEVAPLAGDDFGERLNAVEAEMNRAGRIDNAIGKVKVESAQKVEAAKAGARKRDKQAIAAAMEARAAERKARWAEYQARAKEELDATPVKDIDPKKYAAQLRQALKGRTSAILSRDTATAVQAVQRARYAFALMREAKRRRDAINKAVNRLVKLSRRDAGAIPPVPASALARIMRTYGFRKPAKWGEDPEWAERSMQNMVDYCLEESQASATTDIVPDLAEWVLEEGMPLYVKGGGNWQALTWSDWRDLMDVIDFFRHAAKEQSDTAKDNMRARVNESVQKCVQSMSELKVDMANAREGSFKRSWQSLMRKTFGAVQALQWQARKADGFQNVGPKGEAGWFESKVLRPILEGENKERQMKKEMAEKLSKCYSKLLALSERLENKDSAVNLMNLKDADGNPVVLPEALRREKGRATFTGDQVAAIAMNCGNEGNRQRITGGYDDLSFRTLEALFGTDMAAQIWRDGGKEVTPEMTAVYHGGILTADDWAAVQDVWDALGTLWPGTVDVHRDLFGFAPAKTDVKPVSFRAQGQPVSLAGGYYPIKYDKDVCRQIARWNAKDELFATTEAIYAAPAAKTGHTKSRQKKTNKPLLFSTSVITEHVNDAIKLICFGREVRFADRVTQNDAFAGAYTLKFGKEDYNSIRPNLKGIVRSEPAPDDKLIQFANACRKYLVSAGLWGNLKVALLQTTALGPAMGDLGAGPVLGAMGRMAAGMATGGMSMVRDIWVASPYMHSRWKSFDQDLIEEAQRLDSTKRPKLVHVGDKVYSWEDVVNFGMLPLCAVDMVTSCTIWSAAYAKYMKGRGAPGSLDQESQYHEEAVRFADDAVKKSNPDFDASSRSAFLRAQNSYRLVNAFGSAVTLFAQRSEYMRSALRQGRVTKAEFLRWQAYEMVVPAIAMTLIIGLVRGVVGGDDDDPKELGKLFAESFMDQLSMKLPVAGPLIEDGFKMAMGLSSGGRQPTMRTALDTPVGLFVKLPNAFSQAANGDEDGVKKLAYAVGDIASFIARVPVAKLVRNAERGYDQWQRGEGTPVSMVMPAPGK